MFNFRSLFVVALAGFTALAAAERPRKGGHGKAKGPKNFIFVCTLGFGPTLLHRSLTVSQVVPDGFGQASETMARDYIHWTNNDTVTLPIDEMVIGLVRTRATDSYVTDSAASATAYSCGIKSYNGVSTAISGNCDGMLMDLGNRC
jgi:alkaline phosphatase